MAVHFLSYGDGNYTERKNIIVQEVLDAKLDPPIDKTYAWDRSNIPEFYSKHKEIMDNLPCSGRFIWKPYIILKMLNRIPENDYLIYLDSGSTIINKGEFKESRENRYKEYFEFLKDAKCPILGFAPVQEKDWSYYYTQRDAKHDPQLLNRYDLNHDEFLDSAGMEAGFLLMKNDYRVREAIQFWLDLMTENSCYNTKTSNSADQGLLNIMFWIFGCVMLIHLDFYGIGPFFAARFTDQGQKEGWHLPII